MKLVSCIVFVFIFYICSAQNREIENLVFAGAGIRGIAYSGAISEFEKMSLLKNVKNVAGTSAGAITAMMISLGYSAEEIATIISEAKYEQFNDGKFIFFGGIHRLKKNYGWYLGNKISDWIGNIIEAKTGNENITFKELDEKGFKHLFVTASCLNKQQLLIFSAKTYPDMKVKDAVRISVSIPLYFGAVLIDSAGKVYKNTEQNKNLDIVVDGGIIANFPISIFDSVVLDAEKNKTRCYNYKTLGVMMETEEQMLKDTTDKGLATMKIDNITSYLNAFYTLMMATINRNQLTKEDWKRTITISSVGISPKIKKLSSQQKQNLIESGKHYTEKYLKQFLNL